MQHIFKYVLLLYICALVLSANDHSCPNKCECKRSGPKDAPNWLKIRCGEVEKLSYVEDDDFLNIASEVVQLNLSNNNLTVFQPKVQFVELQKLDLSKNQLTDIQSDQFAEIPNLRRLDLSGNNIKHIDTSAFSNLKHLERLKLNQNQIVTIEKGTFSNLNALKQLDIATNPLKCDCALLWLLEWADKTSVKLMSNPKCETPQTFSGKPLRKLKVGVEIHCKSPAKNRDMPIVELSPDHSQVVFEGDSLKLQCRAPSMTDHFEMFDSSEARDRVEWLWLDSNPRHHFQDINIESRYLADSGLIDSSLMISKLNRNHSGIWNCQLVSHQGNHSKGITVVVISDETRYCPITSTNNNKGTYTWPRTVVNYTVTLPCESIQLTSEVSEQKASYVCSMEGYWEALNTSKCPYISETTKILEQFSKVNLSLAKGSILESAKHFKNYTTDLKVMKDIMDLVYAARTIENYLDYLDAEPELATILFDITNKFMELDRSYLLDADLEDNACARIVRAVERITHFTPSPTFDKTHIVLEEFVVKRESFMGMTCTWYVSSGDASDRLFHCVTYNPSPSSAMQDREIEASVQIPANLFYQLQELEISLGKSTPSILVSMFSNSKLFPIHYNKVVEEEVTSTVVGVKLGNITVTNLTDPVYVMLKPLMQYTYDLVPPTPVWWNTELDNGKGAWTSEGCQLSHELKDNLVFSCRQLGYYGLIQDTSHINYVQTGAKFRFSHPAIYIGTFILFMCLFCAILSYLFSYPSIQMPKKAKHSLVNTWVAISLLCFMYVFGIYQTEDIQVCQIVGLSLHYFTLSSLLWMCVGVNTMYKRLRKNDVIELQDDELPSDEPIQKPILGLYLVGWGIALIVCGISGAVNMKEYSAHSHCFLSSAPALSALYIPFIILLIFLVIFFLLIRCAIYSTDANGHLSEGTQATENVDLDLLEPNFPDSRSMRSISSKTASSEVEDPEHAPMAQLKAYIIFLFIYIFAWVSCALATVKPLKFVLFEEDVFSIVYAVLASLLGLFTIFFYCIARNDVRTQWVVSSRWMKRRGVCFRSRNVSDTSQNLPQIQIQPLPPIPAQTLSELHIISRSSSRSSAQTKSVSHNSTAMKAAADLNSSTLHEPSGTKINNVNLVVLHRQQYRNGTVVPNLIENPTHTAEMFYNPHQSTVARKFFKKQKRNMMKRNNLAPRRGDGHSDNTSVISCPKTKNIKDNSSVDTSIFGTNSKVNNKNIHVESTPKNKAKHKNLNILSDSCDDLSSLNIPVEKLILTTERSRPNKARSKKKENVASNKSSVHENNMRSVSQQCTLEYSSETISDSILDQKSPEKITPIEPPPVPSMRRENSPMGTISTVTEDPQFYYKLAKNYEPSDMSVSVIGSTSEFNSPRIYINPSHELFMTKRAQSRASSVSASEIDELYQQIKRGPKSKHSASEAYMHEAPLRHGSPALSDSEVTSYVPTQRHRKRSGKDETTV